MAIHQVEGPEPAPEPSPEKEKRGLDYLTAAEIEIAERKSGQAFTTLPDPVIPKARLLGALGWVQARRTDSTLTFEAYMSSRTMNQITVELGMDDDEDEEGKDD